MMPSALPVIPRARTSAPAHMSCTHIRAHVCAQVSAQVNAHAYTRANTNVYTHADAPAHIDSHAHDIHRSTHANAHVRTHVHAYTCLPPQNARARAHTSMHKCMRKSLHVPICMSTHAPLARSPAVKRSVRAATSPTNIGMASTGRTGKSASWSEPRLQFEANALLFGCRSTASGSVKSNFGGMLPKAAGSAPAAAMLGSSGLGGGTQRPEYESGQSVGEGVGMLVGSSMEMSLFGSSMEMNLVGKLPPTRLEMKVVSVVLNAAAAVSATKAENVPAIEVLLLAGRAGLLSHLWLYIWQHACGDRTGGRCGSEPFEFLVPMFF